MAFEIFGFLFKPEISIGDITGIAALISSTLLFWLGYSRTRKSEQIKIAREQSDRVSTKKQQFDGLIKGMPKHSETDSVKYMWLSDIYRAISTFIAEIEYFTILVQRKEIEDSGVLPYHAMLMLNTLIDFKISLHGGNTKRSRYFKRNRYFRTWALSKMGRYSFENMVV